MRVAVLASGSKGNSVFVEADGVRVIIDAGISARRVAACLSELSVPPSSVSAIFLTHEHSDHVSCLSPLLRLTGATLYSRPATLEALDRAGALTESRAAVIHDRVKVGGVDVEAFSVPHDAADPVGYAVTGGARFVLATDLGCVTDAVQSAIEGADALVIEANHDPAMLRSGPYPWPLKRRILGRRGHLANIDAALALRRMLRLPSHVILAHLSEENDTPGLAEETVRGELAKAGIAGLSLSVARQDGMVYTDI